MQKELSIIIPIYNCEKYLTQCLNSVLNQTFKNFELILVDDGSTDSSGKICDEYIDKDSRIKVIHKINQGCVLARRAGFEQACGNYISFLDSDDWIDKDFYSYIFEKIENADLYCCGFTSEYENGKQNKETNTIESGVYYEKTLKNLLKQCLYNGTFYKNGVFPALWCKVMKKSLLESVIYSIDSSIKMGEDAAITYPVLAASKKICIDNSNCMYHYRRLNNSMSTSYDNLFFNRLDLLYKHFDEVFIDKTVWNNQLNYYFTFLITIGFFSEFNAFLHSGKNTINNIFNYEWIKKVLNNVDINILSPEAVFVKKTLTKNKSLIRIIIKTIIFKIKSKFFK